MNNLIKFENYLKRKIAKIDSFILEQEKIKKDHEKLKEIIEKIENDITSISISELNEILLEFEQKNEVDIDIKVLNYLISVESYISDPELEVGDLKTNVINLKLLLKEKLQKIYENKKIKILGRSSYVIKSQIEIKERLEKNLSIIKNELDSKLVSKEDLNELFDELQNSDLDKKNILELIRDFTKQYMRCLDKRKSVLLKQLNDNTKKIYEMIGEYSLEIPEEEKDIAEISIEKLNDNEKIIYDKIKNLILSKENSLSVDSRIIIEILSDNFSLSERKELYKKDGKIDWDVVIGDLNQNLIPNLNLKTKEIIKIFEYIISTEKKEQIREKNNLENKNKLSNILEQINDVLINKAIIISKFESIDEISKNTVISIYSLISSGSLENIFDLNTNFTLEEIIFINYLLPSFNEIKDMINEEIINDDIDDDTYNTICNLYEEAVKKYNELISKVSLIKKEEVLSVKTEEKNIYELKDTKNIVLLLKDKDEKFCVEEMLSEGDKREREEKQKSLEKAIQIFSQNYFISEFKRDFNESEGNHGDAKVYEYHSKGTKVYDEEMSPRRLWPTSCNGRVCYINIPICDENKRKLNAIYTNPNFLIEDNAKKTFVIMLVGVIGVFGADHKEYKEFNKRLHANKDYILKIRKLFSDPSTDVEYLVKIIEESRITCQSYSSKKGGRSM